MAYRWTPIRVDGMHSYTVTAFERIYFAGIDGAGACNIEPVEDEGVEDIVQAITAAVQDALRIQEGHPHCYVEIDVIVGAGRIVNAIEDQSRLARQQRPYERSC